MQRDALGLGCVGCGLPGAALLDISELDLLAGRVLDVSTQAAYRGSIADIGRLDVERE